MEMAMQAEVDIFGQRDLNPQSWLALLTDLRAKEQAMTELVSGLVGTVAGTAAITFSSSALIWTESGDFTLSKITDDSALARELGSSNLRAWSIEVDAACDDDTGMSFRATSFQGLWTVEVRGGNCLVRKRTFSERARQNGELEDYVSAVLPRPLGQKVPVGDPGDEGPASREELDATMAGWAAEAMFPPRSAPPPPPPPPLPPPFRIDGEPTIEQITASIRRIVENDGEDGREVKPAPSVAGGKPEPTMDEILASIRKLIDEDKSPSPTRPSQQAEIDALEQRVAWLEGRVEEQSRLIQTLLSARDGYHEA
jgi:hypothetical protein